MELSKFNQRELAKLIVSLQASAGRLDLLMAICDDRELRETLIDRYEAVMKSEGMAVYRASLVPNNPSLKASLADLVKYNAPLQSGGNALVTVLGAAGLFGVRLNEEKSEREKFFFSLQWTRESLRGFEFPVVLWLSGAVAKGVAQQAQDFWSWRGGVFEFERQGAHRGELVVEDGYEEASRQEARRTSRDNDKTAELVENLEQQIAALKQQNVNSPLMGTLYSDLGDAFEKQAAWEKALNAYGQTLEHYSDKDQGRRAEILMKTGRALQACRRYEPARDYYQQALELFEATDNRREQPNAYFQLGNIALDQREFEQARECYQQTLEIEISLEDRQGQASTYHQLGRVAQELREYEQARSYYQQALVIKMEFNDRYKQASTYHNLGMVAQALREYEQARSHYQQALTIYIEFNHRSNQASVYHQLGRVAQELREYEQARSYYQQALAIKIELNDHYRQASTYNQLGVVAEELREYEQARSHYQQALNIYIESNDRPNQANTHHNLGMLAQALREYEQAGSHYQQALDLYIEFNDRYGQASTYSQLGLLSEEVEEFEPAKAYHLQDLQISAEFNDQRRIAFTTDNLARLYETTQDNDLVQQVATVLNESIEAVQQRFAALSAASADEPDPPAEA